MRTTPTLILGGAQIGQHHFADRQRDSADEKEVAKLTDHAWAAGFRFIDTAREYGQSEEKVGRSGWAGGVHTKLSTTDLPAESLAMSLRDLKREKIDLLYLCHDAVTLERYTRTRWREVIRSLGERVDQFGLSIYSDQLSEPLIELDDVAVVQLPLNILTADFPTGVAEKYRSSGKVVYARSVFARGLLLEKSAKISDPAFRQLVVEFHSVCAEMELSPGEVALRWVLSQEDIQGIVLGAASVREVVAIGEWAGKGCFDASQLDFIDQKLADSRRTIDMRTVG